MNQYKMEMKVQRQVHYNESRGSGIYGCHPVEYNTELVRNKYRNVSLQGDTRPLAEGEVYKIQFEGHYMDDTYGAYYKIIEVESEKLDSIESQNRFLKAILSPKQFETIVSAYPNEKIVDLILADKIDVTKTKGIKEKTLTNIKDKLKQNDEMSVLIAGTLEDGFSDSQLKKINDHYGNPQKAIQVIKSNIYELCKIKSLGFLTIDKVAISRGDDPYNKNRTASAINYVIEKELSSGHTWIRRGDLLDKLSKLLELQMDWFISHLDELSEDDYYYVNGDRITFRYVFNQEKSILENLKRLSDSFEMEINKENMLLRIEKLEVEQGFAFTEEQLNVLLEGFKHGVMVINGKGGVGKTLVVSAIIKTLGIDNYITVALSGKAAQVLAQKGIESSTIHRAIGEIERKREKLVASGDIKESDETFLKYDLVVADEFSMIDIPLLLRLLNVMKDGAKLIIVGDSGQLPAIGYGDVLRDLLTTSMFPKYELTKVHRQAAKSGILSLANDIRDGKQVMKYNSSGVTTYGELQDQTVISYTPENKINIAKDILNIAQAYKDKFAKKPSDLFDFQVIVANKDTKDLSVEKLNIELQKVFNPFDFKSVTSRGQTIKVNDKVIHKGNSYDIPVFYTSDQFERHVNEEDKPAVTTIYNGTMGIVSDIYNAGETNGVLVRFDGQVGDVFIETKELDKIQLAYALTVHSSQGSGIKHVVFAIDFGAFVLLSRQLVYTALTRAIEKGVALVENNAMHKAITIDVSEMRRTFLRDIINSQMQH